MELQAIVALVVGVVVVLFVPALVWSAVITGLYQVARDKVRKGVKTVAQRLTVRAE